MALSMVINRQKNGSILKSNLFKRVNCLFILLASLLNSQVIQAEMPRLLMTPDQRQTIEAERQTYLTQPPPEQKIEKTSEKSEAPGLGTEEKTLFVSAILSYQGHKRAQINGEIYQESELKQGIQLHRIAEQSVTLSVHGQWGRAKVGVLYHLKDWPKPPQSKISTEP